MEASLAAWVWAQHAAKVCVTGEIIKMQGLRILNGMNGVLPPEKQLCLNFSSGWLIKFKKRWDLKFVKLHGEGSDADDEAIAAKLAVY